MGVPYRIFDLPCKSILLAKLPTISQQFTNKSRLSRHKRCFTDEVFESREGRTPPSPRYTPVTETEKIPYVIVVRSVLCLKPDKDSGKSNYGEW